MSMEMKNRCLFGSHAPKVGRAGKKNNTNRAELRWFVTEVAAVAVLLRVDPIGVSPTATFAEAQR